MFKNLLYLLTMFALVVLHLLCCSVAMHLARDGESSCSLVIAYLLLGFAAYFTTSYLEFRAGGSERYMEQWVAAMSVAGAVLAAWLLIDAAATLLVLAISTAAFVLIAKPAFQLTLDCELTRFTNYGWFFEWQFRRPDEKGWLESFREQTAWVKRFRRRARSMRLRIAELELLVGTAEVRTVWPLLDASFKGQTAAPLRPIYFSCDRSKGSSSEIGHHTVTMHLSDGSELNLPAGSVTLRKLQALAESPTQYRAILGL